jgi:signal transduction histidine kinase
MVEMTVRDYGLGVPPEQQGLLFNRFVRLPRDLASTVIGNGLGLYLCRTLAEAMGGSIRLESSGVPGEGSAFIVRLPADQAATFAVAAAPPAEALASLDL